MNQNTTDQHKKIVIDFLASQKLGVIATSGATQFPQSALVGFCETAKLELIFGTSNQSRKYKNLKVNRQISFVIGFSSGGTLQYEGLAKQLSQTELANYLNLYDTKNPGSSKFKTNEDQCYFLVSPTWLRFTSYSVDSPANFEIHF